jgi:alkylation response protein AidB-like acyl-CoA dehydrogenase
MTVLSAQDLLRRCAPEAEKMGRLHPDQLALIYEQGWFRMMVPRRYGGLALPLPEVVRIEEAISRADGSAGWTVTLCSGAGWFAGFFPPTALSDLFSDARLCIAGSGTPSGEAHVIPGGHRVTGRWGYASGAHHATAFTANCNVWSDGNPVLTSAGVPLVRPFLFLRDEVRIIEEWNAVGLVATGSHGFEVSGLELSAERAFVIDGTATSEDDPLYRYPFLPLAEATLAVNNSGMMLHFLDCCADVFAQRIDRGRLPVGAPGEMLDALEKARQEIADRRVDFYAALDRSWATMQQDAFEWVRRSSHALVRCVRESTDRLYPYAGLGAARVDTDINRVWRDLHTAGQHPLLVFRG